MLFISVTVDQSLDSGSHLVGRDGVFERPLVLEATVSPILSCHLACLPVFTSKLHLMRIHICSF